MVMPPCKNCPDRVGIECKRICPKWSEYEKAKAVEKELRVRYAREKSADVESRIRHMRRR